MTYFVDFDRTLFDTDRFIDYLRFQNLDRSELSLIEFGALLNDKVTEGALTFARGELAQFLYRDASDFLGRHAKDCVIMTYKNIALQRAKVESAVLFKLAAVVYADRARKGYTLRDVVGQFPKPYLFVDDSVEDLASIKLMIPDCELYEMRREGRAGSQGYNVIKSFVELP